MWNYLHTLVFTAAAKSLQSCPTLCDPIDGSPPGSPVPGILQARTLEWVAVSFSNAWKWKVKVKSLSCVRLLATPWTTAYQAPPSTGFSRQEYWSGVPLPSPLVFTRSFQFGNLCLWVLDIVLNFFTDFFFSPLFSLFPISDIWLLGILDWSLILLLFLSISFYLGGLLSGRLKNYLLPTGCLTSTLVLLTFKVFLLLSSLL